MSDNRRIKVVRTTLQQDISSKLVIRFSKLLHVSMDSRLKICYKDVIFNHRQSKTWTGNDS